MYDDFVTGLLPYGYFAVRVTVYVPGITYEYEGSRSVLEPPSPKSHDQDVGDPDVDTSNCTLRGAVPDMGVPLKEIAGNSGAGVDVAIAAGVIAATGAVLTIM